MRIARPLAAAFVYALLFSANASAATPSYDALVAAAEADATRVDYTALRMAYAASPKYDPYGWSMHATFDALEKSFSDGDCKTTLAKADELVKADYTLIIAHILRAECFDKTGDSVHAVHEHTIARGLLNSILASGDGKAMGTAYVVVTMEEERAVLGHFGLREVRQALLHGNSHMYDGIDGATEAGDTKSLVFQIDAIFASETKMFEPKH